LPVENLAEASLIEAMAEVFIEYKHAGHPLPVWKDGGVVHLFPEQFEVRARLAIYKPSPEKIKWNRFAIFFA